MKTAEVRIFDKDNAPETLKRVVGDNVLSFFILKGCSNEEIYSIIQHKSWYLKSWKSGTTKQYFVYSYSNSEENKIVYCQYGFSPILIRYLQNYLNYTIIGKEVFDSKNITLPVGKYKMWDFQEEAIQAWWDCGKYGIIKSPTASGKSIIGAEIIRRIGKRTIILVHTSDLLLNVWYNHLIDIYGEQLRNRIGIIGGGLTEKDRKIMRIASGGFEENIEKDIVIATSQSLMNNLNKLGKEKFGMLIVDECIPEDSIIWTNRGTFVYKDLNIDKSHKIFCLNDKNEVIEKGYKKVQTVMKKMYRTVVETGDELICSLDHKVLTKNNQDIQTYKKLEDCRNVGRSLSVPYSYEKNLIIARIFGYTLGDGWIDVQKKGGAGGDKYDLDRMSYDLNRIEYNGYVRKERHTKSTIETIKYGKVEVDGTVTQIDFESGFTRLLLSLGYPQGSKTNMKHVIPEWIMKGSLDTKREFLAGYFGAESSNMDSRLSRSFTAIRFNLYKREDLIQNGLYIANQLRTLCEELCVRFSDIRVDEGNIRKDGTKSKKITITIGNSRENMRNICNIGYRYCKRKEIENESQRMYFNHIDLFMKERELLMSKCNDMEKRGYNNKYIRKTIKSMDSMGFSGNSYQSSLFDEDTIIKKDLLGEGITRSVIDGLVTKRPKKQYKGKQVSTLIIDYENWKKKISGEVIYLDILKHEFVNVQQGYDIRINSDNEKEHNYIVNGFVVHNCHHYSADHFRKIASTVGAPARLGLSASLNRSDGTSPLFVGLIGGIAYKIGIKELAKKGLLIEPTFKSIIIEDIESQQKIKECKLKLLEYSRFIKKVSAGSEKKFNYIINLCQQLKNERRKSFMYTDFVTEGDGKVYTRDDYVKALRSVDIRCEGMESKMSALEREDIFDSLKKGQIDTIVFGNMGNEGINIPIASAIVMCNTTASNIKYVQRCGRAMRRHKGKKDCIIYEILLNTYKELQWSQNNFSEYVGEGFRKEIYKIKET